MKQDWERCGCGHYKYLHFFSVPKNIIVCDGCNFKECFKFEEVNKCI